MLYRSHAARLSIVVISSSIPMVLSGCVLATPVYEIPLQVRCDSPVGLGIDFAADGAIPGDPIAVDTVDLFENVSNLHGNRETAMFPFPGSTEDVDVLLLEVVVDAGGDHGVQFVVALPVVQESESEYSFPEGPIVVEGDRCPPP